jgi:hypothetical protein
MADHFSRKTVAGIARVTDVLHPSDMPVSGHPPVNLTVPQAAPMTASDHFADTFNKILAGRGPPHMTTPA